MKMWIKTGIAGGVWGLVSLLAVILVGLAHEATPVKTPFWAYLLFLPAFVALFIAKIILEWGGAPGRLLAEILGEYWMFSIHIISGVLIGAVVGYTFEKWKETKQIRGEK